MSHRKRRSTTPRLGRKRPADSTEGPQKSPPWDDEQEPFPDEMLDLDWLDEEDWDPEPSDWPPQEEGE